MPGLNPNLVTLNVNGFFITGFSDEDVEIEYAEEDAITEHVGFKGEHSTTEQTDNHGMIKFSLKSTSVTSIKVLEALRLAQAEFAVLFKDTSEGAPLTIASDEARIKNQPNRGRGKEEKMVEFMIAIPHLLPADI